jgi:hypothetical protein
MILSFNVQLFSHNLTDVKEDSEPRTSYKLHYSIHIRTLLLLKFISFFSRQQSMRLPFILAFLILGWHRQKCQQCAAVEIMDKMSCIASDASSSGDGTCQDSSNSTAYSRRDLAASDSNGCTLYLAESSIPNSGLGVYTTIPIPKGHPIGLPPTSTRQEGEARTRGEIVFSFHDYSHNMKMISMFPTEEEMNEWTNIVGDLTINDDVSLCVFWAKIGECKSNPTYMDENCARVCAVANADLDLDKLIGIDMLGRRMDYGVESCQEFVERGECDANPSYMMEACPEPCIMEKFDL